MKFTKRAYVKVWQNCPEADREPFRETAAQILQVARKAVM